MPVYDHRYEGMAWTGGPWTYYAEGTRIKYGPVIEKVCATRLGARFGAWRRTRRKAPRYADVVPGRTRRMAERLGVPEAVLYAGRHAADCPCNRCGEGS